MTTIKTVNCAIVIFLLGLTSLIVDTGRLINILPLLYLGAFLASVYSIYDKKDIVLSYFRPSSIMVLYVSLFFFLGSFAFKSKLVLMDTANQFEYYYLKKIGVISFYFFFAIGITLFSQVLSNYNATTTQPQTQSEKRSVSKNLVMRGGRLLLSVIIIVLTPLVEIQLPGGSGNFSSIFFIFAAIHIAYVFKLDSGKSRFCIYTLLAFLLVTFFYSDRRLLFFFIFILCFIEVFDRRTYKIKPMTLLFALTIGTLIMTANIAMSIKRGVGNFDTKSLTDSFRYVDDYLAMDSAQTMMLHDFEGPGTTFHSYNAVNYMLQTGDYKFGSTFVKAFFLPIPRTAFSDKPRSMVDEYTDTLYPAFRKIGGSWVPNFYAEAFWNFGLIGGLLFLLIVYYFLDTIYFKWTGRLRSRARMTDVFFLSSFSFLPFLFRGSGFDLYGLFVILFYCMSCIYRFSWKKRCYDITPPTERGRLGNC